MKRFLKYPFVILLILALLLGGVNSNAAAQGSTPPDPHGRLPLQPGAVLTPAGTAPAVDANNLLQDPGFENGGVGWAQYSTNFDTVLCTVDLCGTGGGTAGPRSGSAWVWMGGVSQGLEVAILTQTVKFPTTPTFLSFYLWIGYAEAGSNVNDIFGVYIDDHPVFIANATQQAAYPTYTQVTVDLSAYSDGASHTIKFLVVTRDYVVNFNLDDIALFSSYWKISGHTSIGGVSLSYLVGGTKTVTSNASGYYEIAIPNGWSGTVTPSKAGYYFSPGSINYTPVTTDIAGQDYTAIRVPSISGSLGPNGAYANLAFLKKGATQPGWLFADQNGNYSLVLEQGWSGTITPYKTGYTFSPAYRTYTNLQTDQTAQDFIPTPASYAISGTLGPKGAYANLAFLRFDATQPGWITADQNGNYFLGMLEYGWSGTITPYKTGYTFSPAYRVYTYIQADQIWQDYTATPITYAISGSLGPNGANAFLEISKNGATQPGWITADQNGNYSLGMLEYGWSGTITPYKTGYAFSPAYHTYNNLQADQTAQDFSTTIVHTISGSLGANGAYATLAFLQNGAAQPVLVTADQNGNYYLGMLEPGWSGTVTPSKTGFTFTPANHVYDNLQADQTAQDFSTALTTYTISGSLGADGAGATVSYTNGTPTTADGSGNYAIIVPYNWSGVVLPSKAGYSFTPLKRTYTNLLVDQTAQDYTTVLNPYTLSGSLGSGGAGATVTYTGGTVLADGSGAYSFSVPADWAGTVTPTKPGAIFTPLSRSYTATPVTGDLPGQDFAAAANLHVIDDFNGDGLTEPSVFRKSTGFWYIHYANDSSSNKQWGNNAAGDITQLGDYNGDGKTDYAVWRKSTGVWYIKYADDTTYSQQWGNVASGDIPVPGDYNGDGKTDIAVWRPTNGTWYVHYMDGTGTSLQWGNNAAGDVPVPADYNGDGVTEFAVFRKSTGFWYIRYADGTSQARQWGNALAGDIPMPGDYNGDGLTELAVWRQSTGFWYIKYADDMSSSQQWGNYAQGDMAVSGDFNGDGKTDYAVWRPSNGTWYVKYADGTSYTQQWGNLGAGDLPLPRR